MTVSKKKSLKKEKKGKKKGLEVSKEEFLSIKPIPSPFFTVLKEEPDRLFLEVNIEQFKKQKLRRKIIPSPNYKKIQLDKLGKFTFELCNGSNTIKQIIKRFQEKYKLTYTETEISVIKYLRMLNARHLIGWQIPKDLVEKNDLKDEQVENLIFE